jgi:hypothetical protein
MRGGKKE